MIYCRTMTSNSIAVLATKERALDVFELMRTEGLSIQAACNKIGIEKRTFNDIVARYPEIQEELEINHKGRIANLAGTIMSDQEKNIEALSKYSETLRLRISGGLLSEKAVSALIKIDKHLQKSFELLRPSKVIEAPPPPTDAAKIRANEILSTMRGAKLVTVERKTETFRMEAGGRITETSPEVVDITLDDMQETEQQAD